MCGRSEQQNDKMIIPTTLGQIGVKSTLMLLGNNTKSLRSFTHSAA
jgi:hypothetical protein